MSNYKRLTKKGSYYVKDDHELDLVLELDENHYETVQDINVICEKLNRLAEFEDKKEQGLMLELPCKVGDTVYYVTKHEKCYVMEFGIVNNISIEHDGIWVNCYYNSGLHYWHKYQDNYDYLFFHIVEAEAKLKELKGEV